MLLFGGKSDILLKTSYIERIVILKLDVLLN